MCSKTFQHWILQHFPHISDWSCLPIYTEDISCDAAFSPLRGNQEIETFRVYLYHLVAEDIHFHAYADHREMHLFDSIALYSWWLACGSRLMYPHLSECVIWQLGYMQYIPRDPYVSAPHAMTHRDMDYMFDDYLNHLVLEEARNTITESHYNYVDSYI